MDPRLSLILLAACASAALAAGKIPISIYFESLCEGSQKFFKEQFSVAYEKVANDIEPEFVPYGHANKSSTGALQCQHGDYECDGNKVLACAVNIIKANSSKDLVTFVNCIMTLNDSELVNKEKTPGISFPVEKCKKEAGTFYDNIITCYNTTQGETFLDTFGKKTNDTFKGEKFGVPYVIYNNMEKNETLSGKFVKNFLNTLCDVTKGENKTLAACNKSSASTIVASLIPAILSVFIARL